MRERRGEGDEREWKRDHQHIPEPVQLQIYQGRKREMKSQAKENKILKREYEPKLERVKLSSDGNKARQTHIQRDRQTNTRDRERDEQVQTIRSAALPAKGK